MNPCDVLILGVGGQGVVTLGDLIARAALTADVPVTFVPTKGMAQRGGFVKVEIRLGHSPVGPRIGGRGADLVASMERSEALKGVPFIRPGGDFVVFDHVWEPTGVLLGEAEYPSTDTVSAAISAAGARLCWLDPQTVPTVEGRSAAGNLFLLGAMFATDGLSDLISPELMAATIAGRWPKAKDLNLLAFHAGRAAGSAT
jgi:indolepyruvate ferredoxin oxidoreductase beta subunit